MGTEIKMLSGIFQAGKSGVRTDIECRLTCNGTLDTLSLHVGDVVMSVPFKEIESLAKKARKGYEGEAEKNNQYDISQIIHHKDARRNK